MNSIKSLFIAVVASVFISGCANKMPNAESNTRENSTVLSSEFKDDGIKIHYTLFGRLERVEVTGLADTWKGSPDLLAEMDAKVKLLKFIHGETASSNTRVSLITQSFERAQDLTANVIENKISKSSEDATSKRNAEKLDKTLVETINAITASGRLTGIRKTGDMRSADGRLYIAKYEWSAKAQTSTEQVRRKMR